MLINENKEQSKIFVGKSRRKTVSSNTENRNGFYEIHLQKTWQTVSDVFE